MTDDQFLPRPASGGEAPRVWDLVNAYGPTVNGLARASATLMPGMAGVSVSAGNAPAGPTVRFATDEISSRIEDLQHTMEEGPCRDAASSRGPVAAADLTTVSWRRRWPRFTPAALDAGVRAVFALPLHAGGVRHDGAVDLYRRAPGGWDHAEQTAARAFAAATAELVTLEEHRLDWTATSAAAVPPPAPGTSAVLLARWFDLTALSEVRGRLRTVSGREGLSGADLDRFVLAVHEAMTNAVRHGGGHGQLLLWSRAGTLWCEVVDHGTGIPQDAIPTRQPGAGQVTRGLWLIRRTCTSCRITTDATGTRLLLGYRLDRP